MTIYDDDPIAGPPPAEYSGTQGYADACVEEPTPQLQCERPTRRDEDDARLTREHMELRARIKAINGFASVAMRELAVKQANEYVERIEAAQAQRWKERR